MTCKDCWRQYLTYKILDDGKVDAISCPETKCEIVVDDDIVIELVTDEKAIQKYQHLITNSFVEVRNSKTSLKRQQFEIFSLFS